MNTIEKLKNRAEELLQEQEMINAINKTMGESERLNKRYEEVNQELACIIRIIKSLEKLK